MFIFLSLGTQPYSCRYSTGANFVLALLRKMADSRSVGCNHGNMWTGDQAQGLRFGGRCLYSWS